MNWILVVEPAAEFDLYDARDWYERQSTGLGDEFLEEIERTFERIQQSPEIFQVMFHQFRQALPKRFPYRIFYRVQRNKVVVVRVLHVSQDHMRELKRR